MGRKKKEKPEVKVPSVVKPILPKPVVAPSVVKPILPKPVAPVVAPVPVVKPVAKPVVTKPIIKPVVKPVKPVYKIVKFRFGWSNNPTGGLVLKGNKAYYLGKETNRKCRKGIIPFVKVPGMGHTMENWCAKNKLELVREVIEV